MRFLAIARNDKKDAFLDFKSENSEFYVGFQKRKYKYLNIFTTIHPFSIKTYFLPKKDCLCPPFCATLRLTLINLFFPYIKFKSNVSLENPQNTP
jgi:hypothetical protein